MNILNFGSINIDLVYTVERFVRPGETLPTRKFERYPGGKGFNQSVALARAGARVIHAGRVGPDGHWLKDYLKNEGVDTRFIFEGEDPTGHAVIQVEESGQNSILLHGGANRQVTKRDIEEAFAATQEGDMLLLQNEINRMGDIITVARALNLKIVFNPAPFSQEIRSYPLGYVDMFILNEVEGAELTGENTPDRILEVMSLVYPKASVVLTLGSQGVHYADANSRHQIKAETVKPVDTTAAGDCFIGYYLAGLASGDSIKGSLVTATQAAAISVTRSGAAASIPTRQEVKRMFCHQDM